MKRPRPNRAQRRSLHGLGGYPMCGAPGCPAPRGPLMRNGPAVDVWLVEHRKAFHPELPPRPERAPLPLLRRAFATRTIELDPVSTDDDGPPNEYQAIDGGSA